MRMGGMARWMGREGMKGEPLVMMVERPGTLEQIGPRTLEQIGPRTAATAAAMKGL